MYFCGKCTSSVHHCIWECCHPQLVKARLEVGHQDKKHIIDYYQLLPTALLHGIPPKMALRPKGSWWSNSPTSALKDSSIHPKVRALFGMSDHHDDTDPFTRWLSPVEHLDAKSVFRKLSGEGDILPVPDLPDKVHGDVPESPSAFSDGSFTNPSMPHFGLAAAAVWWPARDAQLSTLELLHSDYHMTSTGVAIMGYLGGYRSSSTRIELVGVILAIMSSLPVHLACDSQSVVRRAHFYAEHLRHNDTSDLPGKPFLLFKNGDLWFIFHNILRARGPHSFTIKKTKGYALAYVDYLRRFPHL